MSDERDMIIEQYSRNLTAALFPKAEDIPNVPEAFLRKWVLRLSAVVPAIDDLEVITQSLELSARQEITKALGDYAGQRPVWIDPLNLFGGDLLKAHYHGRH